MTYQVLVPYVVKTTSSGVKVMVFTPHSERDVRTLQAVASLPGLRVYRKRRRTPCTPR